MHRKIYSQVVGIRNQFQSTGVFMHCNLKKREIFFFQIAIYVFDDDDDDDGKSGSSSKQQHHSSESANTKLAREKSVKVNVQEKLFPLLYLFWLLWCIEFVLQRDLSKENRARLRCLFPPHNICFGCIASERANDVSLTLCATTFDSLVQKNVAKRK